jgi:hypothetical protein
VRKEIAQYFSVSEKGVNYVADDIVVGSGGSGALEICITATVSQSYHFLNVLLVCVCVCVYVCAWTRVYFNNSTHALPLSYVQFK